MNLFFKKQKVEIVNCDPTMPDNGDTMIVLDKINFINFYKNECVIYFYNSTVGKKIYYEDKESAKKYWNNLLSN